MKPLSSRPERSAVEGPAFCINQKKPGCPILHVSGSTAGDFCLLGDYAKGGLKSFCHPWSPWRPAATEGPRVSPTKPKGEFSRENSPPADRISKIWRSAPDHDLALPALLRIREQYPHIPCFRTCMSYELFSLPAVFSRLK